MHKMTQLLLALHSWLLTLYKKGNRRRSSSVPALKNKYKVGLKMQKPEKRSKIRR